MHVFAALGYVALISFSANAEFHGIIEATRVQKVVTNGTAGARAVFAADIDGDGRMDLATASSGSQPFFSSEIAWYRNIDGNGSLWSTNIVTTSAHSAHSVFAADIDGDGRMDLALSLYTSPSPRD